MATLTTRVEKLESIETAAATPARLLCLGRYDKSDDDVIGLHGGAPRLPDDVPRLPGESLEELQTRAARMIKGPWPLLVGLMYLDDTPLV